MDFLMQPIEGYVDPHLSGNFVANLRRLAMVTERILSVVDQIHSPCRFRQELGAGPCAASAVGRRYGGGVGGGGAATGGEQRRHSDFRGQGGGGG